MCEITTWQGCISHGNPIATLVRSLGMDGTVYLESTEHGSTFGCEFAAVTS